MALADTFLPALFSPPDPTGQVPASPVERTLTALPVKVAGLGVPDPTATAQPSHQASVAMSELVTQDLLGSSPEPFSLKAHARVVKDVREAATAARLAAAQATLQTISQASPAARKGCLERAQVTGLWLSVTPMEDTNTLLSPVEFRDALCLRYDLPPVDLPSHCDGCKKAFDARHAFSCSHGGLLIHRHNEMVVELAELSKMAFTPSAVRAEPRILPGKAAKAPVDLADCEHKPSPTDPSLKDRGDLLVRGLWHHGTDCIIDVSLVDCASTGRTIRNVTTDSALRAREKAKKKKYLARCEAMRRHFAPFVMSTDGVLAAEAKQLLHHLSHRLAAKWAKPYSVVRFHVNARLSIALARAASHCLRGSRVPTSTISTPMWDDAGALALFR